MIEKKIGKITSVKFGRGGYQDAMIGLSVGLGSDKESWGVGDFKGFWDPQTIPVTQHTKWNEETRSAGLADMVRFVSKILSEAKCETVDQLKGKPVEVTFEGMTLKEWRILTEAI